LESFIINIEKNIELWEIYGNGSNPS
jgi:hypothetical protein